MKQFQSRLVHWYKLNKRNLPWRETRDPYLIWLSEIILQQTRVSQGMNYFLKFKNNFPTVGDLAAASELEVLNCWKGLGYYSRARNLHSTAKYIAKEMNGRFPRNYTELLKLKGVGSYTAAAISSFAYNEPKAVVDGNVYRVLSRVFGIETPIDSSSGKREFQELADELLDVKNPGIYNQAIMEFGAVQCLPANPHCESCAFDSFCEAKAKNLVKNLPVKMGKTQVKKKYYVFNIITKDGKLLFEKRNYKGIWRNLFQFPLIEFQDSMDKDMFLQRGGFKWVSQEIKHVLSHQHLYCNFVVNEKTKNIDGENYIWIPFEEIQNIPIPRLIEKYIEQNYERLFYN